MGRVITYLTLTPSIRFPIYFTYHLLYTSLFFLQNHPQLPRCDHGR